MLSILHFDFNNTHIFISLFLVQYVVFLNITSIKKKKEPNSRRGKEQIISYLFLILNVTHIYNYIIQTEASLVNLRKFLWGEYFTWSAKNYNLTEIDL